MLNGEKLSVHAFLFLPIPWIILKSAISHYFLFVCSFQAFFLLFLCHFQCTRSINLKQYFFISLATVKKIIGNFIAGSQTRVEKKSSILHTKWCFVYFMKLLVFFFFFSYCAPYSPQKGDTGDSFICIRFIYPSIRILHYTKCYSMKIEFDSFKLYLIYFLIWKYPAVKLKSKPSAMRMGRLDFYGFSSSF